MFKILAERFQQGFRTSPYPLEAAPARPARFQGLPVLNQSKCRSGCEACMASCPTDAIEKPNGQLRLDMGKCLFCTECVKVCPDEAIAFTDEYQLSTRTRDGLVVGEREWELAAALDGKAKRLFGRSLKLRQVSAGGCNACEADVNVLNTVVFDLSRFGIQFVASPRHADGLLITGPVTENMRIALLKTYEAVPDPKIVIAVGACAISGGPYIDHAEAHNGADSVVPVDLYVPGCPPSPWTILNGLLRLLGRMADQ